MFRLMLVKTLPNFIHLLLGGFGQGIIRLMVYRCFEIIDGRSLQLIVQVLTTQAFAHVAVLSPMKLNLDDAASPTPYYSMVTLTTAN